MLLPFLVYGLGKKFIQHHEVTSQNPVPQDSAEQEVSETKHLVRI